MSNSIKLRINHKFTCVGDKIKRNTFMYVRNSSVYQDKEQIMLENTHTCILSIDDRN
jgi:hypothetical protein